MIDLHLHTTASDGMDSPGQLVARARAAGLTTIGVADHDTMAAVPALRAAARDAGLTLVPGIEITAACGDKDVHVLGYFLDERAPALVAFLACQCVERIRRAREMAHRLAALGVPIDMEELIAASNGKPVSRPAIAQALVAAGHVASLQEAFDRYIAEGKPAYVRRSGSTPADAVRLVTELGGVASLAHPGVTKIDHLLADLVDAGLGALEAYHPDHLPDDTARYLRMARDSRIGVTGGSDFHGAGSHHAEGFGLVTLPAPDFADLCARARRTRPAS